MTDNDAVDGPRLRRSGSHDKLEKSERLEAVLAWFKSDSRLYYKEGDFNDRAF